MSYIGWNILMAFLLFQGILSSQLDMPDYFSYWDEFFCFILFIFWILKLVVNNYHSKKNTLKIVYPWFVIILIGLLGNAIFKYAVPAAIIRYGWIPKISYFFFCST